MRGAALLAGLAASMALLPAGVAGAAFGFAPGSVTIAALDAAGDPDSRAGAHPDRLRIGFALNTTPSGGVDGNLKDLAVDLPPGLTGNPSATSACSREIFDTGPLGGVECPPETAVGRASVFLSGLGELQVPIVNVAPAPEQLAALGANPFFKFPAVMRLRATDSGVTIEQSDIAQVAVQGMQIELWGVPADHQEVVAPRHPFLTMPTRCDGPLGIVLKVRSWQEPDTWHSAQADTGGPLSGCGELGFEPRLEVGLSDPVADSPTGAELKVLLPQNADPDGRASSQPRAVSLAMPEGVSISPAGAAGLDACSDEQLGIGIEVAASCPPSSRVGSVELTGSALRAPLLGSLFVGRELPGDRFRLFAVAKGSGSEAKLAGSVRADPKSGRLTTELANLPQLPLDGIALRFDGGPGALLATPPGCGTAAVEATFEPYAGGPPVRSSDAVAIDRGQGPGCAEPLPFAPSFEAGSTTARAGRPTAFSVTLRRRDGEQGVDRFAISFPPGLTAALGTVDPCGGAAAALAACPAASRIGSAVAELGPGPTPATMLADVHLTGPHRGAPFGLALEFRAALGPFDLGRLTVRATLSIDPRSGQVQVETDPLPRLAEGVPLRFRTIGLDVDRRGFLRNPTSCGSSEVGGAAVSTAGAVARPASPFFLRGCDRLGFRPRVSIALAERRELLRNGNPGLRLALRTRSGDTNLRGADFRLPPILGFDPSGLGALCSRRAAANGNCPPASSVGVALARTPLLREPLRGRIHAVQPPADGLPDLWAVVRGAGIRLDVRARTGIADGRPRVRLVGVPDLPLSSFAMRLRGGPQGILSLSSDPCAHPAPGLDSTVALEGQSRAVRIVRVPLSRRACGANRVG